jgi:hypothetical protein
MSDSYTVMQDMAIKIMGLRRMSSLAWEGMIVGEDDGFEYDLQLACIAEDLAVEVMTLNKYEGHTRFDEVLKYANERGVCLDHAVVELVNKGLDADSRLQAVDGAITDNQGV